MQAPTTSDYRVNSLAITLRAVKSLAPYAKNSRTHSPAQVSQIAASMNEWGWTSPLLIDEHDGIIAGHGRVLAAEKLGIPDVPCIVVRGLSEAQKRALVIADNKLAENAGWDEETLVEELGLLREDDFDLSLTGFDEEDLDRLLGEGGASDGGGDAEDSVPSVPKHPVTRPGDLWLLGRHRVLCGDSTDPLNVERLMDGDLADFCFTSPPYAQQRQYECGGISDWDALMQGVFALLPLVPDAQVLVNLGPVHRDGEWVPYWDGWIQWMRDAGWRRFGWYVWDQGWGLPGDRQGRFAPSHEFVFHFNKASRKANYVLDKKAENIKDKTGEKAVRYEDRALKSVNTSPKSALNPKKIPDSVIRVTRHTGTLGDAGHHPAMFPVELAAQMIQAFTAEGAIVFEPFTGGGSQLVAAEKTGRAFRGLELSEKYTDVVVKRWQQVTGEEAVLEGDGRTFAELAAARPVVDPTLAGAAGEAEARAASDAFGAEEIAFDDADVSLEDLA